MMYYFLLLVPLLAAVELIYFQVATRYQIIDKPNDRSSHDSPTIRGGGIVFSFAFIIWFLVFGGSWWLCVSVLAIAFISLLDDLKPQRAVVRFFVHLAVMILVFNSLSLFNWPWLLLLLALTISLGALNAFNFMDGINGITGLYAFVSLGTYLVINHFLIRFASDSLLISLLTANAIFLYFNFRKKARCFAGDVGSITLAFFQIVFLLQLIVASKELWWVILFLVFGYDSVITIFTRIKNRENIFKPHRKHLYQFLANELKWDHRLVSLTYAFAQLIINIVLIYAIQIEKPWIALIVSGVFLIFYIWFRNLVKGQIDIANR